MRIRAFQILPEETRPLGAGASSLDELTRQLPQGFYTTFTTLSGGTKVPGLHAHLERLYAPARAGGLHPAVDAATLRRRIATLARDNLPNESRIRLILTKDTGEIFVGSQHSERPAEVVYSRGVAVVTTELARAAPRIKDTGFIAASGNQRAQVGRDVFEVLLTKNGRILEGMTSNFYGIRRKSLVTARQGILLGVTRRVVLRVARAHGMTIEYRALSLDDRLDEAFLTSSSRGVVPIVSINGSAVGEGRVGAWTKLLSKAYQMHVQARSESIL